MRTITLVILATALAATWLPAAAGHHCETKIAIYGRSALTPTSPPPYTSTNQGMCPRTDDGLDHTLPPQTEQIFVRVNGDFGVTKPTLRLDLDGLGFAGTTFILERTANAMGPMSYQLGEWINVPSPVPGGEITATVYYPSGPHSSTYTTSINLDLPGTPGPDEANFIVELATEQRPSVG